MISAIFHLAFGGRVSNNEVLRIFPPPLSKGYAIGIPCPKNSTTHRFNSD